MACHASQKKVWLINWLNAPAAPPFWITARRLLVHGIWVRIWPNFYLILFMYSKETVVQATTTLPALFLFCLDEYRSNTHTNFSRAYRAFFSAIYFEKLWFFRECNISLCLSMCLLRTSFVCAVCMKSSVIVFQAIKMWQYTLSRFSTSSWRVGKHVRNYSVCMRIWCRIISVKRLFWKKYDL